MGKRSKSRKKPVEQQRAPRSTPRAAVIALAAALALALTGLLWLRAGGGGEPGVESNATLIAREAGYEVVNSYPHDATAFLQGLVWHDGFFESTGQFGRSSLRRVEYQTGKVLQQVNLDAQHFGEGLALVGDRLYQLTWQSRRGFIYRRDGLELLGEFTYESEGWGLTYDGKSLILSDGTDVLAYFDPDGFKPRRRLAVKFNSRALRELNELEYIEGEIWANVWHDDRLFRIDPASGQVKSYLNLAGLLPAEERSDPEAVLNGIAYDAQGKRIFVSGKLWPRVFEIRLK